MSDQSAGEGCQSEKPREAASEERETVYVKDAPKRVFGNLLIDGPDGQCAYIFSGIEERCQKDAVAHSYLNGDLVEMCAEHAREEVPEPPTAEQQELIPDGGNATSGCYRCLDCGVEIPTDVTNGRSMMNLEGPDCEPPGGHSWSEDTGSEQP